MVKRIEWMHCKVHEWSLAVRSCFLEIMSLLTKNSFFLTWFYAHLLASSFSSNRISQWVEKEGRKGVSFWCGRDDKKHHPVSRKRRGGRRSIDGSRTTTTTDELKSNIWLRDSFIPLFVSLSTCPTKSPSLLIDYRNPLCHVTQKKNVS